MDDPLPQRLAEWTRHTWVRRMAVALYVITLLGLFGVYIGISRMQVQTSVYLTGQPTLSTSQPNPVRGLALHAPTGRERTDLTVELALVSRVSESPDASGKRSTEAFANALKAARNQEQVAAVWKLTPQTDGLIEDALSVPDGVDTGQYWLYLSLKGPELGRFVARRPVEVTTAGYDEIDPVSERTFRANRERRSGLRQGPVSKRAGPIAVDFVPSDGVVARGLRSEITLRTYLADSGEPVPARVEFTRIEAAAGRAAGRTPDYRSLETDEFGLAPLEVNPIGDQILHLEVVPRNPTAFSADQPKNTDKPETSEDSTAKPAGFSTATLDLTTVPSQTAFSVDASVVEAGDETSMQTRTVVGRVRSLFQTGRMFGDLYYGDAWVGATSGPIQDYSARLEWTVPIVQETRIFRLQTHRDLYTAAAAWDARYVAAVPNRGKSTLSDAVRRVYRRALEDEIVSSGTAPAYHKYIANRAAEWSGDEAPSRGQLVALLDAGLRTLPRHFESAPSLFNTQKADREALSKWIGDAQSDLLILTSLALLIALIAVGSIVAIEIRKRRRHADEMRAVDAELVAEGDQPSDRELPPARSPWLETVLTAVVLCTFVLFGVGLVLVLSYM